MYYCLVAPNVIFRSDQKAFTYHSDEPLPVGALVRVSVGKRIVNGVIIRNIHDKPKFKTKPIHSVIEKHVLPQPLLDLADWLSQYYATQFAIVLQTILPTGMHKKRRQVLDQKISVSRERTNIVLNTDQSRAIESLKSKQSGTCILHGVTGSGKTQVYIELAKHEQVHGKSSIIMVPEIALTPQLVAEFKNHFEQTVFTHSGMTESERHQTWQKCLNADKPIIVIGPRSALFMPFAKLGLIVIDEFHEPSFKQDQSPKYSALRAATMLARFHKNAKVVFGSATPSVSDYYLAQASRPESIIELPNTAVRSPSPSVVVVDNKDRNNFRRHRFLSDSLLNVVENAVRNKKQIIIFHNRRGTAPMVICKQCSWTALCVDCRIPLTLHADKHALSCHLCSKKETLPPSCPECGHPDIIIKGIGTKLIEQELRKIFPNTSIARFDSDNDTNETLQSRYQELYDGNVQIIIGTQLLAKGLDLPNLEAVGIIQADTGLHVPDYQAEERVFQLIYQVLGRVGRTKQKSQVVVQTYTPENPTIQQALSKDFPSFYGHQLQVRKSAAFPPFVHLLKLTCTYKTESGAIKAAREVSESIRQKWPNVAQFGPTPAFYERQAGMYRWQIIIKSRSRLDLVEIAKSMPAKWQADLDPATLL